MVGVATCCASQLALWAYVHICTCIYSEHVNCQKQSAELLCVYVVRFEFLIVEVGFILLHQLNQWWHFRILSGGGTTIEEF